MSSYFSILWRRVLKNLQRAYCAPVVYFTVVFHMLISIFLSLCLFVSLSINFFIFCFCFLFFQDLIPRLNIIKLTLTQTKTKIKTQSSTKWRSFLFYFYQGRCFCFLQNKTSYSKYWSCNVVLTCIPMRVCVCVYILFQ